MTDTRLERQLKGLLEKIIGEVRVLLRNKDDLNELEPLLKDYEDCLQLTGIIGNLIDLYFRKAR